ncbi:MAG: DUF3419 family protein [Alphaproteobacteria bacterium]
MTLTAERSSPGTFRKIETAMTHHRPFSREGMQERLFALVFSGLVYPQIWEDPVVDMEALALTSSDHVITIASGGCNVMSYLLAGPARITAVDLNENHVALVKLKLAAAKAMRYHETFFRFFGEADNRTSAGVYRDILRPVLDEEARRYWEGRTLSGRRRIGMFSRNLYRRGLLGRFIGLGHAVARLHGKDPRRMLTARNPIEQRAIYQREIAPILRSPVVRALTRNPASLYGLGIPPAQYKALLSAAKNGGGMEDVLAERLERLACGFPLEDNYFAWQAFGRRYAPRGSGSLPPYLARENYQTIRERVNRVDVLHVNYIEHLRTCPDASRDAYVLLDAQDWMTDAILNDLWREITRTARPGARVIFRTAAEESLLPGRVDDAVLSRWNYDEARCRELAAKDRSAIYGGFHLYTLKPSP